MRDRSSFRAGGGYRGNSLVFGVLIFVALLLLLLDYQGVLTPVRTYITSRMTPLLNSLQHINTSAADWWAGTQDVRQVMAERDALQKENSDLKAQIIRMSQLELENARLREQVRIEADTPWVLLGTEISVQSQVDGRRQAIIGIGSNQGVEVGMAVVSRYQSSPPSLIGVIDEVGDQSANVLLIADYSSLVSAQVYRGDTVVRGIVRGAIQRDGLLQMLEIERDGEIDVGDTVVTAGLTRLFGASLPNSAIPADIPIGIAREVRMDGRSKVVDVQPFIDPELVRYVWIIQSESE
jgi:rod shape-determining protein MreC